MISVLKEDVPQYLHSSRLFANLFQVDDGDLDSAEISVEVPVDCLKQTPEVRNEMDLRALLLTVRYWLVPEYIETSADFFAFTLKHIEVFNRIVPECVHDVPFLLRLRSALIPRRGVTLMGAAAHNGVLPLMKYLHGKGATFEAGARLQSDIASLAAAHGHLDCLQYAVENGCILSNEECELAARGGHLDCLKYAHERGVRFKLKACEVAVQRNKVACMKFIVDTKSIRVQSISPLCEVAARAGHIEMLTYLLSIGCEASLAAANGAAIKDQLECLKLLHDKGCPLSSETTHRAVRYGSIQCLEYLHSVGCGWDARTLQIDLAAMIPSVGGRQQDDQLVRQLIRTFMFAAEHGCPVTHKTMEAAAQFGSIEFIRYLHGRGVELSAEAFRYLVKNTHVSCMQYFLENGYVGGPGDYLLAVRGSCLQGVQCLHEHGVAWDATVTTDAAKREQPSMLRYLLEHGCPVSAHVVITAAQLPHARCLQLLHEHGVPLTEAVVTAAVNANSFECLEYALSQGCPYVPDAAIAAASKGHISCLKCLHKHGALMTPAIVYAALSRATLNCPPDAPDAAYEPLRQLPQIGVPRRVQTGPNYAFECVQYAVQNGCPVDAALLADAELYAEQKVLDWLRKQMT